MVVVMVVMVRVLTCRVLLLLFHISRGCARAKHAQKYIYIFSLSPIGNSRVQRNAKRVQLDIYIYITALRILIRYTHRDTHTHMYNRPSLFLLPLSFLSPPSEQFGASTHTITYHPPRIIASYTLGGPGVVVGHDPALGQPVVLPGREYLLFSKASG